MASKQDSKAKQNAPEDEEKKTVAKSEEAHKEEKSSKAVAADAGDSGETQDIDSLLNLLQGDLSAIDTEAALGAIDEWYGVLHKSKEPEFKELSGHLKELKQALKGGKASGHEIGDLLVQVGEQTYDLAGEAEKGLKTPIHRLGKQLTKIGNSLGKAEEHEQIEQLNSLVDTLEGDLDGIETDAALSTIDHWYAALHKSDEESLKEIAEGLKQLKQMLKGGKADGAKIGEALTKLGEQTTHVGGEAAKGFKRPIQRLGKLLTKAAKSLAKAEAD